MAQRYSDPMSQTRMLDGMCPECGKSPGEHSSDNRFWIPRACDLLAVGVTDRIQQFEQDSVSA